MEPPAHVRNSLRSHSWPQVETYLTTGTDAEHRERLTAVVETVLREGYLIVRHPAPKNIATRDAFLESLEAFIARAGLESLLTQLRSGFCQAQSAEVLYHKLMERVDEITRTAGSPCAIAWACMDLAHREFIKWRSATLAHVVSARSEVDVLSMRIDLADGSPELAPDDVIYAIDVTLSHQLKLLAYQNRWFDSETIVLPAPAPRRASDDAASQLRTLAAMWCQIERSETACRLFGGQIEEMTLTVPCVSGARTVPTVKCSFPIMWDVAIHVAGERLRRHTAAYSAAEAPHTVGDESGAVRPLSTREMHAWGLMRELTGTEVLCHTERIGGLLLWEWIRGYTVLEAIALGHLEDPERAVDLCIVPESAVQKALTDHGMKHDAAITFVERASFGRNSVDLHDCPLVRLSGERVCVLMFPATSQSATRLVLSHCARDGYQFPSKGPALETEVCQLFQRNGVPAIGLKKRVCGQDLEVDCLALWDRMLFVLECKNYALPGESVRHQHSFCLNQQAAADQLLRNVSLIQGHPELVYEAFGRVAQWDKLVPVVVNGMPFSLPGRLGGVYFCDRMSLRQFFGSGIVRCFRAGSKQPGDVPRKGEDIPLWSGEIPTGQDFLAHLHENIFFRLTAAQFKPSWVPVPVSTDLAMVTIMIGRGESVLDEMLRLALAKSGHPDAKSKA